MTMVGQHMTELTYEIPGYKTLNLTEKHKYSLEFEIVISEVV